jgi:hypothetical protein
MSSTLRAPDFSRPITATRRILVVTDGSPSSAAAVTTARSLAEASVERMDVLSNATL